MYNFGFACGMQAQALSTGGAAATAASIKACLQINPSSVDVSCIHSRQPNKRVSLRGCRVIGASSVPDDAACPSGQRVQGR